MRPRGGLDDADGLRGLVEQRAEAPLGGVELLALDDVLEELGEDADAAHVGDQEVRPRARELLEPARPSIA